MLGAYPGATVKHSRYVIDKNFQLLGDIIRSRMPETDQRVNPYETLSPVGRNSALRSLYENFPKNTAGDIEDFDESSVDVAGLNEEDKRMLQEYVAMNEAFGFGFKHALFDFVRTKRRRNSEYRSVLISKWEALLSLSVITEGYKKHIRQLRDVLSINGGLTIGPNVYRSMGMDEEGKGGIFDGERALLMERTVYNSVVNINILRSADSNNDMVRWRNEFIDLYGDEP